VLTVILAIAPAQAHHPGAALDKVMGDKEKFFEKTDRPAPAFELTNRDGEVVSLSDYADKILVVHFVYTSCPDVCPLHADKIQEIQTMINESPMKEIVQFVTITTDPETDTPDVLKTYGRDHNLNPVNWTFMTAAPDQPEDTTRKLAQSFGHKFVKSDDGYQTHGVVTHVIDRGGRWAGNFHGLRFDSVNMVLYINGLINRPPEPKKDQGWIGKLRGLFN
jgi:protein SCO1/2